MTASVYVAASALEIDRAKRAVARLEAAGLRVVSTWIGTVEAVGASNPRDAGADQRRAWSVADLAELQAADLLWFLAPRAPTRGAWAELGCAYAMAKHIVCSGDTAQSIFCALGDEHADDDAALVAIVAWAGAPPAPQPFDGDELLDPTWEGEGPRRARERLERRAGTSSPPPGVDGAQLVAELEAARVRREEGTAK